MLPVVQGAGSGNQPIAVAMTVSLDPMIVPWIMWAAAALVCTGLIGMHKTGCTRLVLHVSSSLMLS